ncbi:MAG: YHS domain-containing protein [Bacteroidales bacterium]|nr:YHS domain-containing protein [Bacteroidales bacterium]
MTYRLFAAATLLTGLLLAASGAAETPAQKAKRILQEEAGEFIGMWKGEGKGSGKTFWKEEADWGWKFKSGDAWIAFKVDGNKALANGTLRYDAQTKKFTLTATDTAGKNLTYTGKFNSRRELLLEATAPDTKDLHRLKLYTVANGARMILKDEVKAGGKGLFSLAYESAVTKEGESFAGGKKKNECVVTGGLGTIAVSYGGKTYYVCCSGCRDEFNADPKKYIAEFEAKHK